MPQRRGAGACRFAVRVLLHPVLPPVHPVAIVPWMSLHWALAWVLHCPPRLAYHMHCYYPACVHTLKPECHLLLYGAAVGLVRVAFGAFLHGRRMQFLLEWLGARSLEKVR